jgi:hypothetical protein
MKSMIDTSTVLRTERLEKLTAAQLVMPFRNFMETECSISSREILVNL